jgi:CubicO group peptidase (beta-lactamase class C family)
MRAMLTMSSGARWNENYEDPDSDEMKMKEIDGGKGSTPVDYGPSAARGQPGTQFHYSTGDADLIGIAGQCHRHADGGLPVEDDLGAFRHGA